MSSSAAEIIALLGLKPHPEGGHYRETWRASASPGERPSGTAIYYLLAENEISHWHRVDADEIWHWHGGATIELSTSVDGRAVTSARLGGNLASGERPQIVIPAHVWQRARSLGSWTLVGCTVSPGFEFAGFEMAAMGWEPTTA